MRMQLLVAVLISVLTPLSARSQTPVSAEASSIYRSTAPSVFLVEVHGTEGQVLGIGSAFLIGGNRLITNAHVVEGGRPHLRTGPVALPLSIDRLDPHNDLAVLISGTPLDAPALTLATSAPTIGSAVFAIGNPRGLERSISGGLVSGVRDHEGRELVQITAAISPGSSGGPVVDRNGQVVGVTVGYLDGGQSLNFAVPIAVLRALLEDPAASGAFHLNLAEARQILSRPAPDFGDQDAWQQYRREAQGALERAAASATDGDELLALATLAEAEFWREQAALYAEDALRRGVQDQDSARIILTEAWKLELIVADEIDTARLRRMLDAADALIAARPRRAATHAFRAQVLSALRRGADAIRSARQAVELGTADKGRSWFWHVYHNTAAEHGTPGDDDVVFRSLVDAGDGDMLDWRRHAEHLEGREEWQASGDAFAQAFRLSDGRNADDACNAGRAYWIADLPDETLDAMRACIEIYALATRVDTAQVVNAHRAIASVLNDRGVYSQAETHARQARTLDPQNAWAVHELARSLLEQERVSEAVIAAEEAIRLSDGRFSTMHFLAGTAYFDLQDWSRCERAFQRADELNPKDTSAAYNVALCLARQGYYRDAAQWMDRVLQRDPNRVDRADLEAMIRRWRR